MPSGWPVGLKWPPAVMKSGPSHLPTAWMWNPWIPGGSLNLIPPSLDPFSAKNRPLERADLEAALSQAGLVGFPQGHGSLSFGRRDVCGQHRARAEEQQALEQRVIERVQHRAHRRDQRKRLDEGAALLGHLAEHLTAHRHVG